MNGRAAHPRTRAESPRRRGCRALRGPPCRRLTTKTERVARFHQRVRLVGSRFASSPVPDPRRQSAGLALRSSQRHLGGCPRPGRPGPAASHPHQLPRRSGRPDGRDNHRQIVGDGEGCVTPVPSPRLCGERARVRGSLR